jgi:hypothetical protein
VARNNNQKSGTHDDFHNFIGSNPWILFYHERMNELGGDVRSSYMNLAYPSLGNDVFLTSDGNTEPPSILNSTNSSSSTSGSGKKKKNDDALTNARLETEKSAVERNNSSRRLMDDLLVGQKRKRRLAIVDDILATAAKIDELETSPNVNDDKMRWKMSLLKKRLDMLQDEESELESFFQDTTDDP